MNSTNQPATFAVVQPGRARRAAHARRADRLPHLIGQTRDAEAVLDQLSVSVWGTGSVGITAALSLAHLQIGELRLVDNGRFKASSPLTQPITPADIGKPKASTIARRCKEISPATRVLAFDGPVQNLPLGDVTGTDVVILAGDNATLEHDAGQICLNLGLTLVHAAVHGESLTATCHVHGTHQADAPCPVCLFQQEEFDMLDQESRWSCEGILEPVDRALPARRAVPTMSLRPLCALAGEIAALTVIRRALGLGQPVDNTLTEINAYTWRTFVTPIKRNRSCPCEHRRFTVQPSSRPLVDCSLRELLRRARPPKSNARAAHTTYAIRLEGFHWVEQGLCACARPQSVHRFCPVMGPVRERCAKCARPVRARPFFTRDTIPVESLKAHLDRPLRALGANDCRGLLVFRGRDTLLLTNPTPPNES